jgi:hypothetical protein
MNEEQLMPESVSSVRFYGSEILISRKMILKLVEGYKG